MQTEQWRKLRRVFESAVELEPKEQSNFLDMECAGDDVLRREVEELIAADSTENERLQFLEDHGILRKDRPGALVGEKIADYEIRRVIGSGGMGTVYEAEQDNPSRRVALKVMRQGLLSESSVRRFRYESEILGRLQHSGIARVYAAGTHRDGDKEVPYFAMELVEDALDLIDFATARDLSVRERVLMIMRVCEAVHHGHLKGVIHRDLKPANILVDASGAPKIIDFGIARCTDADLAGVTVQTQAGIVLGTLHYMSPEQVTGRRDDVDTRTDVYAIGVILYELLVGRLPFDLGDHSIPEAARIICEHEAPKLGQVDRTLRGDLATIVDKAMARERDRRYASAADLARDLENYLADRPIEARPPSTFYQISKFARRNVALVASGSIFALMLIVGVVVVSVQNVRIEEEARTAMRERQKARAVSRFLGGILGEAEAIAGKGPDYTVREALDAAAARIDTEIADQPAIEAEIRTVIGVTYTRLSLFESADPHLVRALELCRTVGDPEPTVRARLALARLRRHQDRLDDAVRLAREAVADGGADARHDLGCYLAERGDHDEAEPELRAALERRLARHGADDRRTLESSFRLGVCLLDAGDDENAAALLRTALDDRERILGADHVDTLVARDAWGRVLRVRREYAASEKNHRTALEGLRTKLGAAHRYTLDAAFGLVWCQAEAGRIPDALPLATETLTHCEKVLSDNHKHTQRLLRLVGGAWMQAGEIAKGLALTQRAYDASAHTKGAAHADTLDIGTDLAYALQSSGNTRQALKVVEASLAQPAGRTGRLGSINFLVKGLCLTSLSRFEEAERLLLRSLEMTRTGRGPNAYETRGILMSLARMYEAWGKKDKAAEYDTEVRRIDGSRKK